MRSHIGAPNPTQETKLDEYRLKPQIRLLWGILISRIFAFFLQGKDDKDGEGDDEAGKGKGKGKKDRDRDPDDSGPWLHETLLKSHPCQGGKNTRDPHF